MSAVLPDARVNKNLEGPGLRARVQKFGGYLASMIMPNIGAFIAWGLITALFIPSGWLPNATLAGLVGPMLFFLLPLLIGYTGGRMVHGQRGAVIASIATFGVIIGGFTDIATLDGIPMFLGAMIMGPLAAFVLKLSDKAIEGKVAPGFEMLVDNFSLGILGMLLAIAGLFGVAPVMAALIAVLTSGVHFLVNANLLPLASIFVEPAKVLFLNNAINHGILTPIATADVAAMGKSILFTVESNPGAGLGLLTAYAFFGPRSLRPSTPGAIIIHFFGGIHEIYFPYVLMKPILLLGMIAGSASGLVVGGLLGSGLVAPPAPGSIFAFLAVTARGAYVGMLAQVFTAALVSFLVCAALMKFGRSSDDSDTTTADGAATSPLGADESPAGLASVSGGDVRKLVIACDAGMGSSVMVASTMKKRLAPYGVEVTHTPVDQIPEDAQVVLTQEGLATRARNRRPEAVVVPFTNYMGDPAFDQIEEAIKNKLPLGAGAPIVAVAPATATTTEAPAAAPTRKRKKSLDPSILSRDGILLGQHAASKEEAIRQAGDLLVALNATDPSYTDAMFARETQVSTFMGNGVAIPHGTNESRGAIKKAQLGFIQYPDGVDWDGKTCHVCIPIASNSDEHVGILSALASVLADKAKAERLQTTTNIDEVLELLAPEED
ncbi:MAG: PTS mannitol transporter subunit IICBA [Brooklawnia sp.]|nr:PTS mannitol transporter subunit IICBA [Brooklawnia sp.]